MSTTCLRKLALSSSVFLLGLAFATPSSFAGDRGFVTIAGKTKNMYKTRGHTYIARSQRPKRRTSKRSVMRDTRHHNRRHYRRDLDGLVIRMPIDAYEPDLTAGFLREKVRYSPTRSRAKIIHVSSAMKKLAEKRAAAREALYYKEADKIEFRYYRPNEAYDVRFPSVVYLDALRK